MSKFVVLCVLILFIGLPGGFGAASPYLWVAAFIAAVFGVCFGVLKTIFR
jgi:hypothetical protein